MESIDNSADPLYKACPASDEFTFNNSTRTCTMTTQYNDLQGASLQGITPEMSTSTEPECCQFGFTQSDPLKKVPLLWACVKNF